MSLHSFDWLFDFIRNLSDHAVSAGDLFERGAEEGVVINVYRMPFINRAAVDDLTEIRASTEAVDILDRAGNIDLLKRRAIPEEPQSEALRLETLGESDVTK